MEKKKRSHIKRTKMSLYFFVIGCILGVGICFVFLMHHLYAIQTPERLRYIKDYQEFTLSIDTVPGCTNEIYPLFQYEDQIYNGICVWKVSVNYGTVKAPLKMVLEEKYIELKDVLKKMGQLELEKQNDTIMQYEYRRSDKINENYRVTVLKNPYQNIELTQITFEPFQEKVEETLEENKN